MLNPSFEKSVLEFYVNIIPRLMPHLDHNSGQIIGTDGKPLKRMQENPYYAGRMTISDGHYVVQKVKQALVDEECLEHLTSTKVEGLEGWVKYFSEKSDEQDKNYVFQSDTSEMSEFKGQFKNWYGDSPNLRKEITKALPEDYVDYNEGTRTIGARIYVSSTIAKRIFPIEGDSDLGKVRVVCLTQSNHNCGIGAIACLDDKLVAEDLTWRYDRKRKCLQGVYRQRDESGNMVEAQDQTIMILNDMIYKNYSKKPSEATTPIQSYCLTN